MRAQVNPLTGRNVRGFQVAAPRWDVQKEYCRTMIERALPAGHVLLSFRYKPFGVPRDSVVEIKVQRPDTEIDTWETRVPINPDGTPWGGPVPKALVDFLEDRY